MPTTGHVTYYYSGQLTCYRQLRPVYWRIGEARWPMYNCAPILNIGRQASCHLFQTPSVLNY